jgi:hypothetical protein
MHFPEMRPFQPTCAKRPAGRSLAADPSPGGPSLQDRSRCRALTLPASAAGLGHSPPVANRAQPLKASGPLGSEPANMALKYASPGALNSGEDARHWYPPQLLVRCTSPSSGPIADGIESSVALAFDAAMAQPRFAMCSRLGTVVRPSLLSGPAIQPPRLSPPPRASSGFQQLAGVGRKLQISGDSRETTAPATPHYHGSASPALTRLQSHGATRHCRCSRATVTLTLRCQLP